MSQAYQDVGVPIGDRIAKMKNSVARLQALQMFYPDLLIKQDPMKDIYQSKIIWSEVDKLEILQGTNVLKVLPYKDKLVSYYDEDKNLNESTYRIYTLPMEISLIGQYMDFEANKTRSLQDQLSVIQIQNYMMRLGDNSYSKELLLKIEYELYSYIKKTILANPKGYRIENDHFLPEKIQTLITFS